jgi:hypothetical protein
LRRRHRAEREFRRGCVRDRSTSAGFRDNVPRLSSDERNEPK